MGVPAIEGRAQLVVGAGHPPEEVAIRTEPAVLGKELGEQIVLEPGPLGVLQHLDVRVLLHRGDRPGWMPDEATTHGWKTYSLTSDGRRKSSASPIEK